MNRIKNLRKEKGITVKDLGEKFGISQSMLTNYENGSSIPRDNDIWTKLADYFDVSIPYLIGLTSRPSDYIKTLVEKNTEQLFKGVKPLEIEVENWAQFQVLNFLENLDEEDMRKTAKYVYKLLQNSKYDASEIPKEYVFVADAISVEEETNKAKITTMRMEALKEKRSDIDGE